MTIILYFLLHLDNQTITDAEDETIMSITQDVKSHTKSLYTSYQHEASRITETESI